MVRLLFLANTSFLFLSSSTAALLGWQQLRVIAFSLILASLAAAAVLCVPRFTMRGRELPFVLLWLLACIALLDVGGSFHPYDYKIVFPVIGILVAPHLSHALDGINLPRVFLFILSTYVLVMCATMVIGAGNVVIRGHDAMSRLDLTGSVVTQASLCVVTFVLASVQAAHSKGIPRVLVLAIAILAGLLVMLTATRTALVTLIVMAALAILAGPDRGRQIRAGIIGVIGTVCLFAIYTLAVSDAFLLRLVGEGQHDYTSGRAHSLLYWLAMAAEQPLGHGIGTIRSMMEDGRPYIDGGLLLEWPHNELIRFYVEGGLPGLLLVLVLLVGMTRRALRAAGSSNDPIGRALVLVLAADMIAQCMLQNYFNTVYHSTMLLLILAVLCDRYAVARQEDRRLLEEGAEGRTGSGGTHVGYAGKFDL